MIGNALKPRLGWLTDLTAGGLANDIIAGLILAILLVPQAMAYAQLAGLPPQTGLFAALLPPVIYAVFGTSNFVSMGPVALVSLVVAEAAGNAPVPPETAAAVIAIEAGLALALLGALGLGRLVNFISEPVLLGFTAAAAFLIAASQLPTLIGVEAPRAGNLPTALEGLWNGLDGFSLATTLIGLASLIALLFINRYAAAILWKLGLHPPLRQAVAKSFPFAVIVAAAFAVSQIAEPVATVAAVERGLPSAALAARRTGALAGAAAQRAGRGGDRVCYRDRGRQIACREQSQPSRHQSRSGGAGLRQYRRRGDGRLCSRGQPQPIGARRG